MEELAPHNAYHAKWAVEALISASHAGLPLEGYAGYARKVLEGHCGPGALEIALGASKSILQGLGESTQQSPPGEVQVTCKEKSGTLEDSVICLQEDFDISSFVKEGRSDTLVLLAHFEHTNENDKKEWERERDEENKLAMSIHKESTIDYSIYKL